MDIRKSDVDAAKSIALLILSLAMCVSFLLWAWPNYRVWSHEMRGKAALVEAKQNRQIRIEEAQANLESEKLNAQAEVIRAKGMAEAMEVEGGALTKEYIQYLWVRSNKFNKNTTIYVPTEANLPIMEASRLNQD